MLRPFIHYGIHFIVPIVIAWLCYRKSFRTACLILIGGIIIDLDHLFATPVFDPNRCSIGFHFLHSYFFIGIYLLLFAYSKTRIYGLALLIHMVADVTDCYLLHL